MLHNHISHCVTSFCRMLDITYCSCSIRAKWLIQTSMTVGYVLPRATLTTRTQLAGCCNVRREPLRSPCGTGPKRPTQSASIRVRQRSSCICWTCGSTRMHTDSGMPADQRDQWGVSGTVFPQRSGLPCSHNYHGCRRPPVFDINLRSYRACDYPSIIKYLVPIDICVYFCLHEHPFVVLFPSITVVLQSSR
jgi:hypothetical protein